MPKSGDQSPRRRGGHGETMAAAFLQLQGFRILDRNRVAGGGEMDLVAREGRALVFVEVRCRGQGARAGALASLDATKRARLRRCASALLREPAFRWPGRTVRMDVVAITWGPGEAELVHLRGVDLGRRH